MKIHTTTLFIEREIDVDFNTSMNDVYDDLFDKLKKYGKYIYHINHFIPNIDVNYQEFNSVRRQQFIKHKYYNTPSSVCVSSNIDNTIRVFVEIGDVEPIVIDNPRQVPTSEYPSRYGKDRPLFSRAVLANDKLYISGTASIVGSASIHHGDLVTQTKETILNIDAIIDQANKIVDRTISTNDLVYIVYLKDYNDRHVVMEIMQYCSKMVHINFEEANMCRPELLIEIEAREI